MKIILTVAALVLLAPLAAPAAGHFEMIASQSRCNTQAANDLGDQLRGLTKKEPSARDRDARFTALQQIVDAARLEEDVLRSVCPENDLDRVDGPLRLTVAQALLAQSAVIASKYAESCPSAKDASTAGFVAAAWYEIAQAEDELPDKNADLASATALVQQRAAAVKLDLPKVDQTSDYWRGEVQKKGQAAAAACPAG